MEKILIKNGSVVTPTETKNVDLLIEGEKIVQVGHNLNVPGAKEIDATGKYLMPGGIDPHVHLDLAMFDTVSSDVLAIPFIVKL